ncbi:MAG: hypothetical protein KME26_20650 [Oscillatoria princeps RMCB-10]|nr:hypothetical protein [Oscillatoria princeps RMCB-10]
MPPQGKPALTGTPDSATPFRDFPPPSLWGGDAGAKERGAVTPWGHRVPVPAAVEWGRDMSRPHTVWTVIPDCRCRTCLLQYNSENSGKMAAGVSDRPAIEASTSADKEHPRGVKHFPAPKS